MIKADYVYLIDWNNDGGFDHAYSDVSADVLKSDFSRGAQGGRPGVAAAGQLNVMLDNSAGKYSPENTSSPLTGLVLPNRRIQFKMTYSGTGYLFSGYLNDIVPDSSKHKNINTAQLTAYGILARYTNDTANLALQENIQTGDAIAAVLAAAGISSDDYDLDGGQSTLSKFWLKPGSKIMQALRSLEAAEIGHLGENPQGQLIFFDRAHLYTQTRSNTVQSTYGTGTLNIWRLKRLSSRAGIYNHAQADVRTFNKSEESVLLATVTDVANGKGGTPILIPADSSKTINIDYPTAGSPNQYIGVNEWGIVDYEANTAADGSGTDLTDDVSAVKTSYGNRQQIVFTNANVTYDVYLVKLAAWGKAQVEGDPIGLESDDSGTGSSIEKYGRKTWPFSLDWETNQVDCQAKLDYLVSEFKDPKNRIQFDVEGNYDATHLAEVKERREGDRIRVVASLADFGLNIDAEFIVDAVRHVIDEGRKHVMTLWCTAAPVTALAPDGEETTPNEIPEQDVVPVNVPDQLTTRALALESTLLIMAQAKKWNAGITEAEIRLQRIQSTAPVVSIDMRTPGEGGTFEHNGTDQFIVEGLFADWQGFRYEFEYGAYTGEWYWSMRFKNADGWSNWTDGNDTPQYVTHHVNTAGDALYDVGPPSDWSVKIKPGVQAGTAVVVASRPAVNSNRIWQVDFQIRDTSAGAGSPVTGFWRDIDADAGAADTLYDGSAIDHTYNPATGELRKASGNYGSGATNGGLLIIDVRQGQFDVNRTIWQRVSAEQFDGEKITGIQPFNTNFALDVNDEYTQLRVKIVRPPWIWNATSPAANDDGFQDTAGYQSQVYWDNPTFGDLNTETFYSNPFIIPSGLTITDLEARAFFTNTFCTTDDDTTSDPAETVKTQEDTKIIVGPILIDGNGSQPGAGYHGAFPVPEDCYLESVTMVADASGGFEIDLRKCSFADWPPDSGDSITGANPPELDSAQKYQDSSLSGWTRAADAGDIISLYVQAGATTVTKVWVTLIFRRTTLAGTDEAETGLVIATPWAYWPMDEVSAFTVPTAPSLYWYGTGSGNAARRLYAKATFQLTADDESLANGDAFGPIYIPYDSYLRGFWKEYLHALTYSTQYGGSGGDAFTDIEGASLEYTRVKGFKVWHGDYIDAIQVCWEKDDESTEYGTKHGGSGGSMDELTLAADEYITSFQIGIKKFYGFIPYVLDRLDIVTNKATYSYGDGDGVDYTITVPAAGAGYAYEVAGTSGRSGEFVDKLGFIFRKRYYDTSQLVPEGAIGWNLYIGTSAGSLSKVNSGYLALSAAYEES